MDGESEGLVSIEFFHARGVKACEQEVDQLVVQDSLEEPHGRDCTATHRLLVSAACLRQVEVVQAIWNASGVRADHGGARAVGCWRSTAYAHTPQQLPDLQSLMPGAAPATKSYEKASIRDLADTSRGAKRFPVGPALKDRRRQTGAEVDQHWRQKATKVNCPSSTR